MHTPITSLPLTLSKILDRIGSDDYYYPFDFSDLVFSGIDPHELLALEGSLRGLVTRIHDLERAVDRSPGYRFAENALDEKKGNTDRASSMRGHRFHPVPLTPDEGSELEPTSSTSTRDYPHFDPTYNGYESSVSNGTTISISSDNQPSDSIVYVHSASADARPSRLRIHF